MFPSRTAFTEDAEWTTSPVGTGTCSKLCWWEPPSNCMPLDFCRDSSLHGLKYISQPRRHLTERIFWFVTFMVGISAAAFLIRDAWRKYQDNPVIVSFDAYETNIDQIPFPAVTICNINKVLKSKADAYIKEAKQIRFSNFSTIGALTNLYFLDHVCSTSKRFSQIFKYSSANGVVDQNLLDLSKEFEDALNGSVENFLKDSSQTCTDMIKLCLWKGEEYDCTELFRPIETDFGKCCTFNMVPTTLLQRFINDSRDDPLAVEQWSRWDQDSWGFPGGSVDVEYPRRQLKAGKTSGLSIMLDPDLQEYFCATADGKGFRLGVHQSTDYPHVSDYGYAIQPNTETLVGVRTQINIAGAGLQRVPLEKRQCYFKGEKTLHYFSRYSSNNCVDECIANLTLTNCSCVQHFMPRKPGVRLCGPQNFACAESVKQSAYRYGVKRICDSCLPVCTEIDYQIESSMTTMDDKDNIWVDEFNSSASWSHRNVSIVHIFFGQDSTYARVRKELYGQTDLIANTGGLLGLCLGFSGLSVMEVVYFLTLRLLCRRRRKRHTVKELTGKVVGLWRKAKGTKRNKSDWDIDRNVNQQEWNAVRQSGPYLTDAEGKRRTKFYQKMTNPPFFIITHELGQIERNFRNKSKDMMKVSPQQYNHYKNTREFS